MNYSTYQPGGKCRIAAQKRIGSSIKPKLIAILQQLGMPDASFRLVDAFFSTYWLWWDNIQLLFSANKELDSSRWKKVSGEEKLSRIILAVKATHRIYQFTHVDFLIEIDTGVSGEIDPTKWPRSWSGWFEIWIVSITRLPQIAARAIIIIKYCKSVHDGQPAQGFVCWATLDRDRRIAQMLSGSWAFRFRH